MKQKYHSILSRRMAVALMALTPLTVQASADPLIEGARQCTQYFPAEEKKNNIPTHLLAAIATTESGRYHKGLGMSVPWPWTINVEGKGYHFDSKAEAIAQTQSLLARGYQSIDVGCMQVNLKHHPKAFANLNQAFDPATNVAYSAQFLRTNYATSGDWIKATAAYHSHTPIYGQKYLLAIERSWNSIVGKVAAARASKAGDAPAPAPAPASARTEVAAVANPRVASSTSRPMLTSQHARVIRVSDSPRRSSEVMVVRVAAPALAVASKPLAVADASGLAASAAMLPVEANAPQGNSIRRVSLDNAPAAAIPMATQTGPKFVFAN